MASCVRQHVTLLSLLLEPWRRSSGKTKYIEPKGRSTVPDGNFYGNDRWLFLIATIFLLLRKRDRQFFWEGNGWLNISLLLLSPSVQTLFRDYVWYKRQEKLFFLELYCGIRQQANACYAYPSNLEQQKFLVTSVGAHLNVTNAVNKL